MTMTIMLRNYKVMKVMVLVLVMARVVTLSNYRDSCERRY